MRSTSPLVAHAQRLAEELLTELPRRRDHVRGVGARAAVLADPLPDREAVLVVTAAWLHDIGYSAALVDTGFHPVDGARFLRRFGFPETVTSLVAHHTGSAFEARERGLSAALDEFPAPPEHLLDYVTCADAETGPDGVAVTADVRLAEILRRYEPEHPVHRAVVLSGHSILAAVDRVHQAQDTP